MKKKTVYSDDEDLSDSEDDKIKSINIETNNNISSDEEIISINVNKKQKKLRNRHTLSHLNKPISKISVVEFSSDEDLLSDSDINDNINKTEITKSISSN